MTTVSPALARTLAAGRGRLNACVAHARQRYPAFDPAHYAAFLREAVDPLVAAVDAFDPSSTVAAGGDACEVAIDLVAQGLAGPAARSSWLDRAWVQLGPALAPLVARAPVATLGAISNAVFNLSTVPGVRIGQWLEALGALAPHADSPARLRDLGVACAWRAGMAHYRAGALQRLDALPEAVALAACGAAPIETWDEVRARLHAQPWWDPATRAVGEGREAGRFTGFGGAFAQPPQVRPTDAGFVVRSGERHFLLVADVHGAVLLPATPDEFDAATLHQRVPVVAGALELGGRTIDLGLPDDGVAAVANGHTVAVTSPWTHAVRLLPRAA